MVESSTAEGTVGKQLHLLLKRVASIRADRKVQRVKNALDVGSCKGDEHNIVNDTQQRLEILTGEVGVDLGR